MTPTAPARSDQPLDNNWLPVIADACRLVLSRGLPQMNISIGSYTHKAAPFRLGMRQDAGKNRMLEIICRPLADQNSNLIGDALGMAINRGYKDKVEQAWSGTHGIFLYDTGMSEPPQPSSWLDVARVAIWVLIKHQTPVYTAPLAIELYIPGDEPRQVTVGRGNIDGRWTDVRVSGDGINADNHQEITSQVENLMVDNYVASGQLVDFRPWTSPDKNTVQFRFCTLLERSSAGGVDFTTAHPRYPQR